MKKYVSLFLALILMLNCAIIPTVTEATTYYTVTVSIDADINNIDGGKSVELFMETELTEIDASTIFITGNTNVLKGETSKIMYSLNGNNPKTGTTYYSSGDGVYTISTDNMTINNDTVDAEPIVLDKAGTYNLRAIASYGSTYSNEYSTTITVKQASTPTITYESSSGSTTIKISASSSSKIYYTTDGSTPDTNDNLYNGTFKVSKSCTIKAIAVRSGYANSDTSSSYVTVTSSPTPTPTATPTASPTAKPTATPTASPTAKPTATPTATPTTTPYTSGDDESNDDEITLDMNCSFNDTYGYAAVTITASDKNAKIYYSTDDEDPDESSSLYTGPLYFYDETTICAVAINGNNSSDVYYMDVTFYEDESDEDDEDSEYEDEEEYDEEYEESEDEEYSDDYDYADDEYSGDMIYSDWAEEELLVAIEDGLIPDEMLDENLTTAISREKFAAIAVTLYESLSGSSAPNVDIEDTPFEDCYLSESEYVGYIGSAYALGIVNGVSSNEFAPYMAISREELATMLCRVVKKRTISGWSISNDRELDTSGASKFADDSYISDFAKNSVYFMAKNGVIKGIDDTHFAPKNVTEYERSIGYATATKEQAILMSKRCYENFDDFDITYR